MSTIKLTPFWLFLILLAVLLISILFLKKKTSSEGLINFNGDALVNTTITIPNYNNTLIKLYDNDYFDPKNGSVLRIYGAKYDPSKPNVDKQGSSIDYIDVLSRNNSIKQYLPADKIPEVSTRLKSSYDTWNTYTTDPKYKYITSNQLFYIAWDKYTYLHLIDMETNKHAHGYIFANNSSIVPNTYHHENYEKTITISLPTYDDVNTNNNTFVSDTHLQNNYHLYQLCSTIYYNQNTHDLIIGNYLGYAISTKTNVKIDNEYDIYDRNGNTISCFSDKNLKAAKKIWFIDDNTGKNIVIFINLPNDDVIIAVLQKNSDNVTYKLVNVKRFKANGNMQMNESTILPNPDASALATLNYNNCAVGTVPSGTVPSGTVPSGTVPSGAVPSGTVRSGAVPSDAVPSGSVPSCSNNATGTTCNAQSIVDVINKSMNEYNK